MGFLLLCAEAGTSISALTFPNDVKCVCFPQSFFLGCISEGPANYAKIVHCGFLIKSRGTEEYETDFPQDKSHKWKVDAAPSAFFFFTSLQEMFVVLEQIPFKNKQTLMNTGLLLLL